ncbi:hypothetical protein [Subtercola boreus]|uniref:hypothetical protein n=1 Tax=Subtercola boreus TaxID=120213 RepID=UPI001559C3B9|nr:hypothetical protein [Subtercola boreus]
MAAKTIAEDLYAGGLQGEDLYKAMWDWHDQTGIETRDMYTHYQTLRHHNQPIR